MEASALAPTPEVPPVKLGRKHTFLLDVLVDHYDCYVILSPDRIMISDNCHISFTYSLQEGIDSYIQAGVCVQGIYTVKWKTLRDSEGCIVSIIDE